MIVDQFAHAHGQLVARGDEQIGRFGVLLIPIPPELRRHLLCDVTANDLLVQLLPRRGPVRVLRGARIIEVV